MIWRFRYHAAVVVVIAVLWWMLLDTSITPVNGDSRPEFENVRKLFSNMLQHDNEGATLAVLHRGKLLVNLYGGCADSSKNQGWTKNTMAVAYSSTKIWAGLVAAILAGRKQLNYDQKVSTFWPEFAQNGKENTTVMDILDHRAGLLTFGKDFELEEAKDIEFMSKLIEQATPLWPPGSTRAYHPLTYGFLVDQLVTRLDPKHRTVAQFYREEIWKTGIDFSIGSEGLNKDSIARICDPSTSQSVMAHAWRPLRFLYTFWKHITSGGLAMTAANYPSFLGIMGKDPIPYNDPAIRALPLVSCMGIGTAAGFAKAVHQVIKKKLIPEKLWNVINKPIATEHDMVLLKDMSFGHGFFYHPHPVTKEEWIIRIVGNGLQVVEMDRENEIITVMLRNGLRPGDDGMAQFEKISASIFETILEN